MASSWVQQMLLLIKEAWQKLPVECHPWGVWITLHIPIPVDAYDRVLLPTHTIRQVWFLEGGMSMPQERNSNTFTRFWVMHFGRIWDGADCASPDPRFTSPRCFPLGIASFALYADSHDIYLGTL